MINCQIHHNKKKITRLALPDKTRQAANDNSGKSSHDTERLDVIVECNTKLMFMF